MSLLFCSTLSHPLCTNFVRRARTHVHAHIHPWNFSCIQILNRTGHAREGISPKINSFNTKHNYGALFSSLLALFESWDTAFSIVARLGGEGPRNCGWIVRRWKWFIYSPKCPDKLWGVLWDISGFHRGVVDAFVLLRYYVACVDSSSKKLRPTTTNIRCLTSQKSESFNSGISFPGGKTAGPWNLPLTSIECRG